MAVALKNHEHANAFNLIIFKTILLLQDGEDEDDGRTRRVGFSLSEDFTEKEGRLQRRDTPHHLKNKRISSSAGKTSESEAEKVRRILAMVTTGSQPSTSATSDDTDLRPSVTVVYFVFYGFYLSHCYSIAWDRL